MDQIREAMLEIIKETNNRVSLAQIPQHLRKKLSFEVNPIVLGFSKLKYLILALDDRFAIDFHG